MYRCVHCQKEKLDCRCQTPFKTPDTAHDLPGRKRILRLMFDLPDFNELSPEFVELMNSAVARSMDRVLERVFVGGDRNRLLRPPWHIAEETQHTFFTTINFDRAYYLTKHGDNNE